MENKTLAVYGLKKYFAVAGKYFWSPKQFIRAVDGVSFEIAAGKTLGIVGESGCGKSTLGMVILGFFKPTAGRAVFAGRDLFALDKKDLTAIRWKMQMVYQDPLSSLDPRWTVRSILSEPFMIHKREKGSQREAILRRVIERVGLRPNHLDAYPHEFSGGQRQRIVIARAMVAKPSLMILDEPTSALDVSVQSQILNLLKELQQEFQIAYMFISHDLSVVKHMSDRIAVMYLGRLVEMAPADEFFGRPKHPYTRALISAIPDISLDTEEIVIHGEVPSPINPPAGCGFHPRCSYRRDVCCRSAPTLVRVADEHYASCFMYTSQPKEYKP